MWRPPKEPSLESGAHHAPELQVAMQRAGLRLRRERATEAQAELQESMSGRWTRTAQMRDFLASLEACMPPESRSAAMGAWLDWARRYVDQFDPLSDRGLADLRRNAEILVPDPVDGEPRDSDEQYWRDMDADSDATGHHFRSFTGHLDR